MFALKDQRILVPAILLHRVLRMRSPRLTYGVTPRLLRRHLAVIARGWNGAERGTSLGVVCVERQYILLLCWPLRVGTAVRMFFVVMVALRDVPVPLVWYVAWVGGETGGRGNAAVSRLRSGRRS